MERQIKRDAGQQCMQEKCKENLSKGSYLEFTVCADTQKFVWSPDDVGDCPNKGWKSEKIKLVSATLCHLTALQLAGYNCKKKRQIHTEIQLQTEIQIQIEIQIGTDTYMYIYKHKNWKSNW